MINWFPGHMKKTYDSLIKNIKKFDFVIQILDSRAIEFTSNKELLQIFENKIILNISLKSDISDVNSQNYKNVLFLSKNSNNFKHKVTQKLNDLFKLEKKDDLPSYFSPINTGIVVGLPNIGKSTFINKLANQKKATVMNLPGTTKTVTIQKITDNLFIYDSPGIMYKKIDTLVSGYVLCLIGVISKKVVPLFDVLNFGLKFLKKYYLEIYLKIFGKKYINYEDEIYYLATKWSFIINNEINYELVLNKLYDLFTSGNIGKISYDNKELSTLLV